MKILFSKGYVGVDVFLLLSSYGLCHSLRMGGHFTFYIKRFKRLFPMYVFYLLIYFYFFEKNISDIDFIKKSCCQITGLSSFKAIETNMEWFTPAIIAVYIGFPLLFNTIKKYITKFSLKTELIVFTILCLATYGINSVIISNLAYRIPIVVIGILTFFHIKNNENESLFILYLSCAILGILISCELLCYSLILPIILYCINKIDFKYPLTNMLKWCGVHSFELYLAQSIMIKHLMQSGIINSWWVAIIIGIIGIPILAMFFYYAHSITLSIFNFSANK